MEPLTPLSGVASPRDVLSSIVGLGPGVYLSRDLYDRYVRWAKANDKVPAHQVSVGQVLKRLGATRTKRNGLAAWGIEIAMTRGPSVLDRR